MTKYIWQDGHWTEVSCVSRRVAGPFLIRDTMAPLRHMATGQMFDSKSAFRAATKAAGCLELGNDAAPAPRAWGPDPDLKQDIGQAIQMVEQGKSVAPQPAAGEIRTYG